MNLKIILLAYIIALIGCNEKAKVKERMHNLNKNNSEIDSLKEALDNDFERLDSLEESFKE